MAETGPQKYLAFRDQTEAVANFNTDFQAHIFNDRMDDQERIRLYVLNIKNIQNVEPEPYVLDFLSGFCTANAYLELDAGNQATFQALTGLS